MRLTELTGVSSVPLMHASSEARRLLVASVIVLRVSLLGSVRRTGLASVEHALCQMLVLLPHRWPLIELLLMVDEIEVWASKPASLRFLWL